MNQIHFFSENITFVLKNKTKIRDWLSKCAGSEKHQIESLNYIFCSDTYLRKINKQYLQHDYFTDIITFPTGMPGTKSISGDIFISIDTIKENALSFDVPVYDELHRVLIHGLLHLCGYGDKTAAQQKVMRAKEDHYLKKRVKSDLF